MAIEILHLSSVVKSALVDRNGDRLGRVEDLIVKLGDNPHPPLSGLVVRIGQRSLFVPIDRIAAIDPGRVEMVGDTVNLQRFERRPGELLLVKDLLARHLINLQGARLIRANEIEIARLDGRWEIVGVDPSPRVALRRLLPRWLARASRVSIHSESPSLDFGLSLSPTAGCCLPFTSTCTARPKSFHASRTSA